ncbi:hypothetical protein AB0B63_07170 [Micromonospora sp. NPDC049081]|uniref:hypothetical protein n=1 Tax=Micromonospora sp. NPDC049081 TaxID=3155150 RepID=UPI0033FFA8CE
MILESSTGYWATGITLRWYGHRQAWAGHVDFYDDGFAGDDNADAGKISTEGRLHTRYYVRSGGTTTGIRTVIDTLIADAERLGITFGGRTGKANLYYDGDSENTEFPPPQGWREMLTVEAERIGWECPYARVEATGG